MRLTRSLLLSLFAASASCVGGPVSDWPRGGSGDPPAVDDSDEPPVAGPGASPAGPETEVPGRSDGVNPGAPGFGMDGGVRTPSVDGSDAQVPDGGRLPDTLCSVKASDAGACEEPDCDAVQRCQPL